MEVDRAEQPPMSSHHHHHHPAPHGTQGGGNSPVHVPYWKRAHTDWRFWIGVVLMFAAMLIYIMSFDLRLRPRLQPMPPTSEPISR